MMAVALAMPCLVRLLGLLVAAGGCREVVATGDREDLMLLGLTDRVPGCKRKQIVIMEENR